MIFKWEVNISRDISGHPRADQPSSVLPYLREERRERGDRHGTFWFSVGGSSSRVRRTSFRAIFLKSGLCNKATYSTGCGSGKVTNFLQPDAAHSKYNYIFHEGKSVGL